MKPLSGKKVLITGVSNPDGIGFGVAKRLASLGADLFIQSYAPYDRAMSPEKPVAHPEDLREQLAELGTTVAHGEFDFSDPQVPATVLKNARDTLGQVDILIINHTHDTQQKFGELTSDEIDRHLSINVRASLLLVKEFVGALQDNAGGRIILLTSGQHLGPMPDLAYVASKGALHQLTSSLSALLIEKGITVNTVNPGPTRTYTPAEELDQAVLDKMPQGRWGEPDDAARLISWLVSDDARWVTGQVIDSEGGFRRG